MRFNFKIPKDSHAFLKEAMSTLRKCGDNITLREAGCEVKYIRGENILGHGMGEKFQMYKQVTKNDGTIFLTNSNVFSDGIYINEIFHFEPNGLYPDKTWEILQAGFSKQYDIISGTKNMQGRPQMLKDLLNKRFRANPNQSFISKVKHTAKTKQTKETGETNNTHSYNQDKFHQTGDNTYHQQSTNNNRTYGQQEHSQSTTNKKTMTKKDFINHIENKIAHFGISSKSNLCLLKDAEIRNLAKLFGITEKELRTMDKTLFRQLCIKFHPDKNNDEYAEGIIKILLKFKP